jgi:predicted membrane-bound mannosyltransferase
LDGLETLSVSMTVLAVVLRAMVFLLLGNESGSLQCFIVYSIHEPCVFYKIPMNCNIPWLVVHR